MRHTSLRPNARAFLACFVAGAGGVVLAALAIVSPEVSVATAPWGLMLWAGPAGFSIGAALGLIAWGMTRSLMTLSFVQHPVARLAVAMVPAAIGAAAGYASFASARPVVAAATMIGGALGLLCGVMEASAAARRKPDSPQ
ncbi:hypothetical protein [Microbacterium sp. CFBP 8794]|uniref:hypothetical protein n=1 Tax=Microbacterium sp. CFBP 8794 TaxID=2775269 RepID=UPI001784BF83|nr:hypothetical protein [Microbacterium sp. CFBP 8794]MBD8478342.1 hypothetical protein [Microbacterium sp. CFBP 8794]